MLIKIENLAPKTIINFYTPQPMLSSGLFCLAEHGDSVVDDTISAILQIDGVKRCLLADNAVGVMFDETADAEEIKALVLAELDDFFAEQRTINPEAVQKSKAEKEILVAAEALADSFIRPTLNRDNGDIVITDFADGVLSVKFTGHCAGCPYAQNTLNNVIASCLKKYLPEISSVRMKE